MNHWQAMHSPPGLGADTIHVWRLPTVAPDGAIDWLDAGERARMGAMADAAGRARVLATRGGLRRVLASYLDTDPAAVELTVAGAGKPRVAGGPEFNLTHCGDLALLAVAARPVGIDVERRRKVPRALAIARRVLDADIQAHLAALPLDRLDTAFLLAWTAMEARQKCLGHGVFGQRVGTGQVGTLAFDADADHVGHLAWADPEAKPDIAWFALTP